MHGLYGPRLKKIRSDDCSRRPPAGGAAGFDIKITELRSQQNENEIGHQK
jgi:hypothetical protein